MIAQVLCVRLEVNMCRKGLPVGVRLGEVFDLESVRLTEELMYIRDRHFAGSAQKRST